MTIAWDQEGFQEMDGFDIPMGGRSHRPPAGGLVEVSAGHGLTFRLDLGKPSLPGREGAVRLAILGSWGERNQELGQDRLLADVTAAWRELAFELQDSDCGVGLPRAQPLAYLRRCGLVVATVLPGASDSTAALVDTEDLLGALERIGHGLAVRLPSAHAAVQGWRSRAPSSEADVQLFQARLLDVSPATLLSLGVPLATSAADLVYPDDLQVAARRVRGRLGESALRVALQRIRQYPEKPTEDLDELAARLTASVPIRGGEPPHEHGQRCAAWLRQDLGVVEDARIDVEAVVRRLGIDVDSANLQDAAVDAFAAWGSHGPVVMVNTRGRHSRSFGGRRATIAHELCHLLLDRRQEMPVSDVCGSGVRTGIGFVERRANAFAAELLLPRRVAVRRLAELSGVFETVERLRRQFGVGITLALHQMDNHPEDVSAPTPEQKAVITSWLAEVKRRSHATTRRHFEGEALDGGLFESELDNPLA